jgi:hypothetical protein
LISGFRNVSVVPRLNFSRSPDDVDDIGDVENDEGDPEDDTPFAEGTIWCENTNEVWTEKRRV